MTIPSPALTCLWPAAGGVQALSMNSLRSAWTPLLPGLPNPSYSGEGNLCVILAIELVQKTGLVTGILGWPKSPAGTSVGGLVVTTRFPRQEGAASEIAIFNSIGTPGVHRISDEGSRCYPLDYVEGGKFEARRQELSAIFDATNPDFK